MRYRTAAERAMHKRAGAQLRVGVNSQTLSNVLSKKRQLVLACVVVVAGISLFNFAMEFAVGTWLRGAMSGAFAALVAEMIWDTSRTAAGQEYKHDGASGELLTAEELLALDRGFDIFHDITLRKGETAWNIDHVVVGRAQVFAIETKWHNPARTSIRLRDHSQRAQGNARDVRLRLYSATKTRFDVIPVVACWGARPTAEELRSVDGVTVLPGAELASWLREHDHGESISTELRTAVTGALHHLIHKEEQHIAAAPGSAIERFGPDVVAKGIGIAVAGMSPFALLGRWFPVVMLAVPLAGWFVAGVCALIRRRFSPRSRPWETLNVAIRTGLIAGALMLGVLAVAVTWDALVAR